MGRFKFGKKAIQQQQDAERAGSPPVLTESQQQNLDKKRKSRIKSSTTAAADFLSSPPRSPSSSFKRRSFTSKLSAHSASPANRHQHAFVEDDGVHDGVHDEPIDADHHHPHHVVSPLAKKTMPSIQEPLPYPQSADVGAVGLNSPSYNRKPLPRAATAVAGVSSPWNRFKIFDSPFPRYRHAASSITSDKNELFIMGGLKEGSVFGDTWKIVPQEGHDGEVLSYIAENIEIANNNSPPARVGHSSVLCGNAFIIYGGDTVETDEDGFPDNNFYLFNINNNKYTIPAHIQNKPNGRYGHTLGVISLNNSSSRLYLFGGQLENDVFNDLYYFELNSFKSPKASWKLVYPLNNFKPPPLTNHSMSVHDNKIYVFGGVYNNERVSNDLWVFDPEEEKWTQVETTGTVPLPVNEHSSCVVNDKLYIYGGNDFSGIIYSALYVLDLNTMVWFKLAESAEENGPGPRCGHSMTFLPKYNKIIIMGGDKNDYIAREPDNFDTYETFNGVEVGTMIYELDTATVDQFMAEPVENAKKPRKMAASAAPKESEFGGRYDRHARSFSAGPEDYATPRASPPPDTRHDFQEQEPHSSSPPPSAAAGAAGAGAAGAAGAKTVDHFDHDGLTSPYNNKELITPQDTPVETTNGHFSDIKDDDIEDEEPQYERRMSLDPRFGREEIKEEPVSNGVSGAGVAAAFAAAGAAGAAAGHTDAIAHDSDNDTIGKSPPVLTSRAFNDHSYTQESHYPEDNDESHYMNQTTYEKKESYYNDEDAESHYNQRDSTYYQQSHYNEEQEQEEAAAEAETETETEAPLRGFGITAPKLQPVEKSSTSSSTENDAKVKKIIAELTNELVQLKQSTKEQMQKATEKIELLEQQNADKQASHERDVKNYTQQLHQQDSMIAELKSSLDPSAWDPEAPTPKGNLSDLTKYRLERLELNNKLVYLEQENENMKKKLGEFEPFMNNQIGQLDKFQKVIKVQEDQIDKLTDQVRDQQSLNREINDWKAKFQNLELEYANYKAIHNDDQLDLEGHEELNEDGASISDKSILSRAKSRKDISSRLENLVSIWNAKQLQQQSETGREVSPAVLTPENNPVVAKLQSQVDALIRIGKQNDETSSIEIENLRKELESKLLTVRNLEENYKESLQSVKNTSKALKLNQDELNHQRHLMEKLTRENNELRMYKRASSKRNAALSSATPSSNFDEGSGFATPKESDDDEDDDDDEEPVISSAHYNMKIKDLEADLYILKQERDQLKDNVTSLQKQLYLATNK
ncbi:uncharacterized protein LODBEIA_P29570 [Lodderomyces beijingensis]|uniref:Uncharacterized protein n=1 Tax=Lodderomyces beijingensis TaxID=1775926 RepID=A0ABP0ZM58_9ASCO